MQQSSPQTLMLTVAEALVLQNTQQAQGRAALKLTMLDLLARRVLRLRPEATKGRLGRTRTMEYLWLDPNAAARLDQYPHVSIAMDVIRSAGKPGTEPTVQQVVGHAQKTFGADLQGYQADYVIPALERRGLVQAARRKVLGLFPTTRYQRTPEGDVALQQVQSHIDTARRIPGMLDNGNSQEIGALVAGLGASLLLVDELRPHYRRLSQLLRTGGTTEDDDALAFMPATGTTGAHERELEPQDGPLDVDTSLDVFDARDFSFDSFDSLDASLDAFDSSFDASADSGGSDGDGGGSD